MSEETDVGAGLVVVEDEQMGDEREVTGIQKWSSPVGEQSIVMMTGDEFTDEPRSVGEVGKEGLEPTELSSSPVGSFQSLHSSQDSDKNRMIHYVPPSEGVKVLQFSDTLPEMDCRNFNLIYESLLLERKAGNLTDLMVGMVLAEKPSAWLQVMHGRLKHLIISSEVFQKKKKAEYNAQAKTKPTGKAKAMGKHSKGIIYLGVSGKGKRPHRKITKSKVTPLITKVTSRNNQSFGLMTGI